MCAFASRILLLIATATLVSCASVASKTEASASNAVPVQDEESEELMSGPSASRVTSAVVAPRGRAMHPREQGAATAAGAFSLASPNLMRVHLLNIGAGSCHIVECPNSDDVLLYDCGQMAPTDDDLSADEVRAYTENVIGDDEPTVVISHADTDHVSLISKVMQGHVPQTVWFGGAREEYKGSVATWLDNLPDGKAFFDWKPGWHERGQAVPELKCGDAETFMLTVNVGDTTNSKSLMLLMRYGNFSAVFSGDAVGETEESAMENFDALLEDVTLLTGSHHGARSHRSNHQAWANKTAPQIVVYSAGVSHGHPTATAAKRYRASILPSKKHAMWLSPAKPDEEEFDSRQAEYTTELSGTIIVETDGTTVDVTCSRQPDCF